MQAVNTLALTLTLLVSPSINDVGVLETPPLDFSLRPAPAKPPFDNSIPPLKQAGQISRGDLQGLLQRGGGIDDRGYFRRPIPINQLNGQWCSNCYVYLEMNWAPGQHVVLFFDAQALVRIDFALSNNFQY